MFITSQEAHGAGWFSRRNKTKAAYEAVKEKREAKARMKREGAKERSEIAAGMSPEERIDALNRRLGYGVGAERERARLKARISAVASGKAVREERVTKEKVKVARNRLKRHRPDLENGRL